MEKIEEDLLRELHGSAERAFASGVRYKGLRMMNMGKLEGLRFAYYAVCDRDSLYITQLWKALNHLGEQVVDVGDLDHAGILALAQRFADGPADNSFFCDEVWGAHPV